MKKPIPGLIVPDTHAPYHNKRAWNLMVKVARTRGVGWIVCIGDLGDWYSVSDHDKKADRANRLANELDSVNTCLDDLDALGAKTKIFCEGNHTDRLQRYLMRHPELSDVISAPKLLRLKERGWSFTPYRGHARLGKVHFTHDVGVSTRNAIFRSLDLYQHSIITGHTHRMQYVVEGNALGTNPKIAASFGWLGDVEQVDYMNLAKARSSWALGFGYGHINPTNGYLYLQPVPILPDYSCMVDGILFKG